MITCNRCGAKNNNANLKCDRCGHKLQSGKGSELRSSISNKEQEKSHKLNLEHDNPYSKDTEAWIYAIFLLISVIFFTYHQFYWPLYFLAPLIAIIAWFRKI